MNLESPRAALIKPSSSTIEARTALPTAPLFLTLGLGLVAIAWQISGGQKLAFGQFRPIWILELTNGMRCIVSACDQGGIEEIFLRAEKRQQKAFRGAHCWLEPPLGSSPCRNARATHTLLACLRQVTSSRMRPPPLMTAQRNGSRKIFGDSRQRTAGWSPP